MIAPKIRDSEVGLIPNSSTVKFPLFMPSEQIRGIVFVYTKLKRCSKVFLHEINQLICCTPTRL